MYIEREELIKGIKKKDSMSKGIKQGIEQGIEQVTKHIILKMFNNNFSYEDISKATRISKNEIKDFIL